MVVFAPGRTLDSYPNGRNSLATIEEQVDAFYDMYDVWLLKIAEQAVNIQDSGFAVLSILNPYFELIARYHLGFTSKEVEAKRMSTKLVGQGILLVFPGLPKALKILLAEGLRHSIAHIGLTGERIRLSENYQYALTVVLDPVTNEFSYFEINPGLWVKCMRNHFEVYVQQLRDSQNSKLRNAFSRCFLETI